MLSACTLVIRSRLSRSAACAASWASCALRWESCRAFDDDDAEKEEDVDVGAGAGAGVEVEIVPEGVGADVKVCW